MGQGERTGTRRQGLEGHRRQGTASLHPRHHPQPGIRGGGATAQGVVHRARDAPLRSGVSATRLGKAPTAILWWRGRLAVRRQPPSGDSALVSCRPCWRRSAETAAGGWARRRAGLSACGTSKNSLRALRLRKAASWSPTIAGPCRSIVQLSITTQTAPGVIIVARTLARSQAAAWLHLLWASSASEEYVNSIYSVP